MSSIAESWRVESWADFLPTTLGYYSPPVDLFAVARHRRIKQLRLRLMVPRGVLLPAEGGFEVYLRDVTRQDIDISGTEPTGFLSARQRFSFAHEIAHTYFYKLSNSVPVAHHSLSNAKELEDICDRAAGHILIPTSLLSREIKNKIGDPENIDTAFVRSAASSFHTSLPVVINRLAHAAPSNPFQRCVVLLRRIESDAQIRALYFGIGLLPVLPKPKRYARLTEWLTDFPRAEITSRKDSAWRHPQTGRMLLFEKTELPSGTDFFLQIQVASAH